MVFLAFACSPSYRLATQPPGAEIFAGEKKLGATPMTVSASDIPEPQRTGGGVLVRMQKDGYKDVWVWLPESWHDYSFTLNLTPFYLRGDDDERATVEEEAGRRDLYRITHILLEMQTKLMFGDTKATEELDRILKANPTLGSAHFLAALKSLYEKKNDQSLDLLRDAMRFAPEEPDFLELFNEVSQSKVAGKK